MPSRYMSLLLIISMLLMQSTDESPNDFGKNH